MQGGGGSPEQSQRVVFGRQLDENYSQTSARQAKPRFRLQARALAFNAKGGEPAEPVLCLDSGLSVKKCAFTMAEILLSLTIIGVVAAITLPSLTGNINERTWNTQRKALYARMSQAISLMPALNGYGTLTEDESGNITEDTAAETFVTAGLSKVLKINNICDNEHLEDCGIPSKLTNMKGSVIDSFPVTLVALNEMFNGSYMSVYSTGSHLYSYSQSDTKAAAFETQNGESIVTYYNPQCIGSLAENEFHYSQPKMCANFIYDLNGTKGPNTVGKDIGFITVLYPSDASVVAPMPISQALPYSFAKPQADAGLACKSVDNESRLPNREELAAMFYNKKLLGLSDGFYWSSTLDYTSDGLQAWAHHFGVGDHYPAQRTGANSFICIKR